jgi:hypothetical protein
MTPQTPPALSLDDRARIAAMAAAVSSPRFARLAHSGGDAGVVQVFYREDDGSEYDSGYSAPAWVFETLTQEAWFPAARLSAERGDRVVTGMTDNELLRVLHDLLHERNAVGDRVARRSALQLIEAHLGIARRDHAEAPSRYPLEPEADS